jgi:hypothetical protein
MWLGRYKYLLLLLLLLDTNQRPANILDVPPSVDQCDRC